MYDIAHPLFFFLILHSPFVVSSHPYGILACLKKECHFEERSFHVRVWKRCDRPHCDDGFFGGRIDVLALLHLTT